VVCVCLETVSVGGFSSFERHLWFVKLEMCFLMCVVCNSPVFYLTNGIFQSCTSVLLVPHFYASMRMEPILEK